MLDGAAELPELRAPFPWFGGKSRVAGIVWDAFGDVANYVEPFFGSGAVLLGRPSEPKVETVNDADGFVANFWRALAADPDGVAAAADWPVNENDLHARHVWLVGRRADLTARLEGDPDYFDAKIAGWWVWGISAWIGGGWCSGAGPWGVVDGRLEMGDSGRGVRRNLPRLGDPGTGVHRKIPDVGARGKGIHGSCAPPLLGWMRALAARLRRVRVCCGDWSRVMTASPTIHAGVPCGVFLDPPYDGSQHDVAYSVDAPGIAREVNAWCVEHGGDQRLRIALCGYDGEHDNLEALGWRVHAWKAKGGYGGQGAGRGRENAGRERIWFSPGCLDAAQPRLI